MMRTGWFWAAVVAAGALIADGASAQPLPDAGATHAAAVPQSPSFTDAAAGAVELHRPFALSLIPSLGTNGSESHRSVNNLHLGLIGAHAGRLEGFSAALVGTWFDRDVRGLQSSLAHNHAGGTLTGLQSAVGLNTVASDATGLQAAVAGNVVSGDLRGTQAAVGFNTAGGSVRGAQLAVGFNVAGGAVHGLQASVGVSVAPRDLTGAQLGTGVSVVRSRLEGLQATAGVGYAGSVRGAQLSLVNVGGEVDGAQVGLINVAAKVRGAQVGLLNIAGESSASVGLLSFVPQGTHLQAYATDATIANVALRMGGRSVHTLLILGYQPGPVDERHLSLGVGIGAHLPITARLYADVDLISHRLHRGFWAMEDRNIHAQLRAVAGLQLASHFSIFAGVTANAFIDWEEGEAFQLSEGWGWKHAAGPVDLRVWPGLVAGIQL